MPTKRARWVFSQKGVTLVETIAFIVIIAIGLTALMMAFNQSATQSLDPVIRVKALEKAQALLDEILSRKFSSTTPTGGVPACGSTTGVACGAISNNAQLRNVGDYQGYADNSEPEFPVSVTVAAAGADLGLAAGNARLVTVVVGMPDGNSVTLSAYKVNF
jgi:MSHA pilin protein MshD